MNKLVLREDKNGISTLTLNRPESLMSAPRDGSLRNFDNSDRVIVEISVSQQLKGLVGLLHDTKASFMPRGMFNKRGDLLF